MTTNPRIPPHSLDAEASVIGGVLLRNDVLLQLDTLDADDFYDMRHKAIWYAVRNLEAAGTPIDVVTLEVELEKRGKLDAVGGVAYLGQLALTVPTVDNVVAYAEIVMDKHRARQCIQAGADIVDRGFDSSIDVGEFLAWAQGLVSRIDRGRKEEHTLVGDLVNRRLKEHEAMAEARQRGETAMTGIPTGIKTLDEKVGGYPLGDLTIIAARPAMGKTALVMSGVDAATAAGYGAHVFSPEGGWRMYADRVLAKHSGIAVERLRAGDLRPGDGAGIGTAMLKAKLRTNWKVDTRSGLSMQEVIRSVRKWRAELKTRVVVIDYIQIFRRPPGMTEHEALDANVTALADFAVQDDLAVIALSQLNREVEKRPDKRPQKSDLRGSGTLEERARLIISPYRGAYYYDEPREGIDYECSCLSGAPCGHKPTIEQFQQLVQILLLKNSNGREGYAPATWIAETTEMR